MATLATVYNRFLGPRVATTAASENAILVADNQYALRSIPNEDLYLFVKEIDNTRVVRQPDPQAFGYCWRLIVSGGLAVLLLIGVLLPSAAGRIAGYQLQSLKQEHERLVADKAAIEIEEAALLSPQHIDEIAREQHFIDPAAPQMVVYLPAPAKSPTLAMVRK